MYIYINIDHHVGTNPSSSTAAPAGSQFNIETVYSTVAEASAEYEDSSLLLLSVSKCMQLIPTYIHRYISVYI